ncbi:prophage Lp1 protein 15 [Lactiplantibacillus plantarum]|uniref:helix-turn-helix domain-containing protein n=1 Tax=Lactiplantibacillus plantarum TaxID=1590 RepID=UPI0005E2E785|nr:helix-turn-helix domain-containing protein [Lactiplantibacillus plantarum]KZU69526.1 prophage Lp1 protein 15 [Lactiplantibacillus plantarum]KZU92818.1 prophage Lp1 protein 15 [Lactiplantibacillus plantarum]MCG0809834.1 DNA-binding protein [Lactiplantibacillus plantarum]CDN28320.1 prophage Lp1 protein 15 [Lactiplantibacillus plantarum]
MMISMQNDDTEFIDAVAVAVADRIMPQLEVLVKKYYTPDQGLNQQQAASMLGCSVDTLKDFYYYQPGFPHFKKGTKDSFSQKALEKWMADNQIRA